MLRWNDRKVKLDRACALNDRKSEKKFKELIAKFIEWLATAEEDEDEEEEDEEEEEEVKAAVVEKPKVSTESEGIRKQRELIAKQKAEQQKVLDAKKEEAAKAIADR